MTAAFRLWWLLRSTSERPREAATGTAFSLATWALLAVVTLADLAGRADTLDRTLIGALGLLALALVLTALVAVRSLLRRDADRRLVVLRSAGATRAQTSLVCGLEIADSALPGVAVGVLSHVLLWWAVARAGAEANPGTGVVVLPVVLLALAVALVVRGRVRAATP